MSKCKRCGEELTYKGMGRPRKYCEDCAIIEKREADLMRIRRKIALVTTDFFEHAFEDFKRERDECLREIKKLGIRRQFS